MEHQKRSVESAQRQRSRQSPRSSSLILKLIGTFKLFKAILLIVVGIGALKFLHKDIGSTVMHWTQVLRVDPDNRYIHGLLLRIFRVTPKQLKELSLGTLIYAGLFTTEGVGLLLRKRWAEWLTTVITSSLVPVEIYEIHRHFGWVKVGVLAVNVAVVVYLIWHMRVADRKLR